MNAKKTSFSFPFYRHPSVLKYIHFFSVAGGCDSFISHHPPLLPPHGSCNMPTPVVNRLNSDVTSMPPVIRLCMDVVGVGEAIRSGWLSSAAICVRSGGTDCLDGDFRSNIANGWQYMASRDRAVGQVEG